MFELTNEQRKCFALLPVEPGWTRIEPKPSPYDAHTTIVYADGTLARKIIQTGDNLYHEFEISQPLSDDLRYILPKTSRGKPAPLTAASISKRTGVGMGISFCRHKTGNSYIDIFSHASERSYYTNDCEPLVTEGIADFEAWVETWRAETTAEDLADIVAFAAQPRRHQKFREGDVFRFKLSRRLWGYGRLILDYDRMRKTKEPFWDTLFGKPMVCGVYHIATEDPHISVERLRDLPSLPSGHMMDNKLFYGELEIIGHIPISEREDYPIMYGSHGFSARLQWGKIFRQSDEKALWNTYSNNSIGFRLNCQLPILLRCIEAGSNAPYWERDHWSAHHDLRNPALRDRLNTALAQFGLPPVDTLPSD